MLVASETLAATNAYFTMDQAVPTSCPASNERTPNQYHMLALDHMIREAIGLPLSDALPLRQHKLLQRGERRYFAPAAAVEDSRGAVQLGRRALIITLTPTRLASSTLASSTPTALLRISQSMWWLTRGRKAGAPG